MDIKFYKFLRIFIIIFLIFLYSFAIFIGMNDMDLLIDLIIIIFILINFPLFFIYIYIKQIIALDYKKKTFSVELVKDDLIITFDKDTFSVPRSNINSIGEYYYKKCNKNLSNKEKKEILYWLLNDYWYLLKRGSENIIVVDEQDLFKRFSISNEVSEDEKQNILRIKKVNNIIFKDILLIFFLSLIFLLAFFFFHIFYDIYTDIKLFIVIICFGAILFTLLMYYLFNYLKLSIFKKRFKEGKVYSMHCVPAGVKECIPNGSIHDILFKNNNKKQSNYYGLIIKNLNNIHLNKWFIGFEKRNDVIGSHKLYVIRSKDEYIDTILIYEKELLQQKKKS